MKLKEKFISNIPMFIMAAGFFIFAVAFFSLVPLIGDDWGYKTSNVTNFAALKSSVEGFFRDVNGRVLGNAFSSILSQFSVLRAVICGAVTSAIIILSARNAQFKSYTGAAIGFMLIFAVPSIIFQQTYGWFAGFNNYVVPALPLLVYTLMLTPLFEGKKIGFTWGKAIGAFVCGISAQLFVENVTIYAVLMALAVIVWHIISTRKLSVITIIFAAGAIAGAVIMFASPIYRSVAASTDNYRTLAGNLGDIFKLMHDQTYGIVTYLYFKCNRPLTLLLTLAGLLLLYKSPESEKSCRRVLRRICIVALPMCCVYMFVSYGVFAELYSNYFRYIFMCIDFAFEAAFVICLCTVALLFTNNKAAGKRTVFFLVSAVIAAAPMLIVTPLGGRCLYMTAVFNGIALMNMIKCVAEEYSISAKRALVPIAVLCASTVVVYLVIFGSIYKTTNEKYDYIEAKMSEGEKEITVPVSPYASYIKDAADPNLMFEYYYDEYGDITYNYVQYNEWLNTK